MSKNDIFGKVSLWQNDVAPDSKKPVLTGKIRDENGNVIAEIALWKNPSTNEMAPFLTGVIKPLYNKAAQKGTSVF